MVRKAGANLYAIIVCLGFLAVGLGSSGRASAAAGTDGPNLSEMIPPDAIVWVERRGHTAIKPVFDASNLGRLFQDAAMNKFLQESRVKIGQAIVKGLFALTTDAEAQGHQKMLHQFLQPFWYDHCAMFVTMKDGAETPSMGFYCVTGKYKDTCKSAVEALMKVGVGPEGIAGERQAFTHTSGKLKWTGVAKKGYEWTLAKDPDGRAEQLKEASLFMVAWSGDLLLVATGLDAADDAARMLPGADKRPRSKAASAGYRAVLAHTPLKDWAFRWYLDVERILKITKDSSNRTFWFAVTMGPVNLEGTRAIGGVSGYADNVQTRLTFFDIPKPAGGLTILLARKGSYKQALGLLPTNCPLAMAGQLDPNAVAGWLRKMMIAQKRQMAMIRQQMMSAMQGDDAPQPGDMPAVTLDEDEKKLVEQIAAICKASSGAAAMALTELPDLRGAPPSGAPICLVVHLKDAAEATKVIDKIIEDAGTAGQGQGMQSGVTYRKLVGPILVAVAKDRLIFAGTESAMKTAIGAPKGSPTTQPSKQMTKMTALAGDAPAIIRFDVPTLSKWLLTKTPVTMLLAGEDSPIAPLPEADKIASLLSPEVVVVQPVKGGLLFKSRGTLPLLSKLLTVQVGSLVQAIPMLMRQSQSVSGPSGPPDMPPPPGDDGF